jgi:F-type H+-transporting ATPase subunit delta
MLNKKIARRYAKALLELGKEQGQTEGFRKELKTFAGLLKQSPLLEECLASPLYSAEDLKKIIVEITNKMAMSETIQNFLCLLVDKRRIQYFSAIEEAYDDFTNELLGYVKARIITATPLPDEDYNTLKQSLEKVTDKKIILSANIEPDLLGGVIAEVGDTVFDGSIRNQLHKIGETLT